MELVKGIKKIIKEKVKVKKGHEKLQNVFVLRCEVCGSTKTRYDGKDFELWDKDLWEKSHRHKIRRFLRI